MILYQQQKEKKKLARFLGFLRDLFSFKWKFQMKINLIYSAYTIKKEKKKRVENEINYYNYVFNFAIYLRSNFISK